jgi:hypothetical protein
MDSTTFLWQTFWKILYYHCIETWIVNGVRDHVENCVLARKYMGLHSCRQIYGNWEKLVRKQRKEDTLCT